jgi:hypothetical protein
MSRNFATTVVPLDVDRVRPFVVVTVGRHHHHGVLVAGHERTVEGAISDWSAGRLDQLDGNAGRDVGADVLHRDRVLDPVLGAARVD